jgi:hypothetical protein
MWIGVDVACDERVHGDAEGGGIQDRDDEHAPRAQDLERGEPGNVFGEKPWREQEIILAISKWQIAIGSWLLALGSWRLAKLGSAKTNGLKAKS